MSARSPTGEAATCATPHADGRIEVRLQRPLERGALTELTIEYGGQPSRGLWFTRDARGQSLVYTHGECTDAPWWFPCANDLTDRATSELLVRMPVSWTSFAAGERIDSTIVGDSKVERWRMSTAYPAYLTSLVAGELTVVESTWNGIPLAFAAPPSWEAFLQPSLECTPDVLTFLSDWTGLHYPFPKYAQVCVPGFPFGGMENISATTLTVDTLSDSAGQLDQSSVDLIVHEAAHQWFGDAITVDDWSHVWIHEGFATYLPALFALESQGPDAFGAKMRAIRETYLSRDRGDNVRPIVHAHYLGNPLELFFTGHVYQGGATRLHFLRSVLGEEDFLAGVRLFLGRHLGRAVETRDLQLAFEEVSGLELGGLFEQWLFEPGHPEIETRWRFDPSREQVILTVNQVHEVGGSVPTAFRAPVTVEIMGEGGPVSHRIELTQRRQKFEIACPGPPVWVRFDKGRGLPAVVRETKRLEEWYRILTADDDVNGRLDAIVALRDARIAVQSDETGGEGAQAIDNALLEALAGDPSPIVRASSARVIAPAMKGAREALTAAARDDSSSSVRAASLRSLSRFGADDALASLAERTFESTSSWAVKGARGGAVRSRGAGSCVRLADRAHEGVTERYLATPPHGGHGAGRSRPRHRARPAARRRAAARRALGRERLRGTARAGRASARPALRLGAGGGGTPAAARVAVAPTASGRARSSRGRRRRARDALARGEYRRKASLARERGLLNAAFSRRLN